MGGATSSDCQGPSGRHWTRLKAVRSQLEGPLSSSPASRALGCDQEKRTLARLPASVSELACVATGLPSLVQECEPDSLSSFPSVCLALRTDSPMDLRGSHGNFPHFSLPSESFESLLLPPRSARLEVSAGLTSNLQHLQPALLLVDRYCRSTVGVRSLASAPSIFRATSFGR